MKDIGFIVRNNSESRKVQDYLFRKGYRWHKTFTKNTYEYFEMKKGKFCNIVIISEDKTLDYYVINTNSAFKEISRNIKALVTIDNKLTI